MLLHTLCYNFQHQYNILDLYNLYCSLIKETINSAKSSIPAREKKKDKAKDEGKTKTIQELDREKLEKKFSKDDKEKLN